jgi:phage gpG-like protein
MSKYLKNLGGAKKSFRIKAENISKFIREQVEIVGRNVELEAKKAAPVDLGKLRQSIFYESTKGGLGARITANIRYAAFQEFGTGGKVDVPQGFEKVAKQFQTGDGRMSIKAQPYLIPSAKKGHEDLVRRLKRKIAK